MPSDTVELVRFNEARDLYLQGRFNASLSILEAIPNLDTSFLRKEIKEETGNSAYLEKLISTRSNDLLGVFECSYHPYLKLEYSRLTDVFPSFDSGSTFSNIRCVIQQLSTAGLSNDQVVALFPENFKSVSVREEHPVFYFVNKFTKRHLRYTRPVINDCRLTSFFAPLLSLSEKKINQLVANWVNIHEQSHRKGVMPLPKYLEEKSNRYTAAMEELRADLNTIQTCWTLSDKKTTDEYLTGLYVLGERLLAYPKFREKTNFDAISSVIMWKFLKQEGVFETSKTHKIKDSVGTLINYIASLEALALNEISMEARKSKLRSLIMSFLGNYEEEFIAYNAYWRNT